MSLRRMDIYCAISHKDALVDLLLEKGYDDFYFFPCNRYGAGILLTSLKEQVSARRDFAMFRLYLDVSEAPLLSENVKQTLKDPTVKIFLNEATEL